MILKVYKDFKVILDSSMVEHAAVNRGVVGSSPTRGVNQPEGMDKDNGSLVKRLRHRPFTAVTRVRFPLESSTFVKLFILCRCGSIGRAADL